MKAPDLRSDFVNLATKTAGESSGMSGDGAMGSLFPRLPDEIGLECLLRVELSSHHNIGLVCKSWNAALQNRQFYSERKRLKISEQRVCMILRESDDIQIKVAIYDPKNNSCKNLPPSPSTSRRCKYHCHFVKRRLVLIADGSWKHTGNYVWLFDFSCWKWKC